MKLRIGTETDNNKTHLYYAKTSSRPKNSPSYLIETDKADEFVQKYNDQDTNLNIMGWFITTASAIMGWSIAYEGGQTLKRSVIGLLAGISTGFALSAFISHVKKNKLMDKYKIKN